MMGSFYLLFSRLPRVCGDRRGRRRIHKDDEKKKKAQKVFAVLCNF